LNDDFISPHHKSENSIASNNDDIHPIAIIFEVGPLFISHGPHFMQGVEHFQKGDQEMANESKVQQSELFCLMSICWRLSF